jgi:predicted kinase
MPPPCLILIAGLPATGKTSFAKYLSGKMEIPMVSKDIVKEHLFDTIGFKNRDEKVALGIAAMDLMYHFADLHLELGKPIILENNFENVSKPGLHKLIEKYRCKKLTIRFQTDIKVLSERFLQRDRSPERHRGHVINTRYPETGEAVSVSSETLSFNDYYDRMKQRGMEFFSIGGEEIIVDTTDFSKVSYDAIYEQVKT